MWYFFPRHVREWPAHRVIPSICLSFHQLEIFYSVKKENLVNTLYIIIVVVFFPPGAHRHGVSVVHAQLLRSLLPPQTPQELPRKVQLHLSCESTLKQAILAIYSPLSRGIVVMVG